MNEHADLSRVYQQAARPEPAAALDDAILAAARQAAGAGPRRVYAKRWWSVPLALAATVLLSVSITTMVHDQQPTGDALYAPPRLALPSAEVAAPAPAAQPSATLGKATAPRAEPAAVPALAPVPVARRDTASERATAELTPAFSAPKADVAKADAARAESALADRRAANTLLVPPAEQAALAPPAAMASDAAAPAAAGMLSGMAARPAAPAMAEKRARTLSLHEDAARTADGRDAEAWIAEIRDLQRAGRRADAVARLAEFRQRFPAYALPDDLKASAAK